MTEIFEFLLRFLFGVSGALVIIFLRIYEQLPRMSKSGEIILREETLKDLQTRWTEIHGKLEKIQEKMGKEMMENAKSPNHADLDVKELEALSNSYKITLDDISERMKLVGKEVGSLKLRQWTIGAILFTFLGGIFALFIPEVIGGKPVIADGMISGEGAIFSMLVGATWTTYISMFEHKLSDKELVENKNTVIDELIAVRDKVVGELESTTRKGAKLLSRYKDVKEDLENYKKEYDKLSSEYEKLKEKGG